MSKVIGYTKDWIPTADISNQVDTILHQNMTSSAENEILGKESLEIAISEDQDTLVHYGVLGMKWGVRKDRRKSSSSRSSKSSSKSSKSKVKEAYFSKKKKSKKTDKKVSNTSKKKVSDMSDEELRKAINRLQMEKTYKSLTTKDTSSGRSYVNQLLRQSGSNLVNGITNNVGQALGQIIGEEMKRSRKVNK